MVQLKSREITSEFIDDSDSDMHAFVVYCDGPGTSTTTVSNAHCTCNISPGSSGTSARTLRDDRREPSNPKSPDRADSNVPLAVE